MIDENPVPPPSEESVDAILEKAPEPPAIEKEAAPVENIEPVEAEPAATVEQESEAAPDLDANVLVQSRKYTRRSFAIAAASTAAGYGFYRWIDASVDDMMQPSPLRRAFQANAAISRTVFEERALAPMYRLDQAENLRVNGVYGLKQALIPESWRLQLVGVRDQRLHPRFTSDVTAWEYRYADAPTVEDKGHDTKIAPGSDTAEKMSPERMVDIQKKMQNRVVRMPRGQEEASESRFTLQAGTAGLLLMMQDILKLPRHELVTQFKCIEGWSQIVHWAGVRMADFLDAYPPALVNGREPKYVYMETPNGDYYTGYDMDSCRHPQTLLATEMMGEPITQYHGSPLRLHMPTKYGYKQIKRIGLISYINEKPDDYWTKLGYDWYAGL
jgi:DMSO/TMAO reductase YedYZ molybdopterin-dependent catalytic subunit